MKETPIEIGWREWLALPDLGIPAIKAKVDTGARTSALHTEFQDIFEERGVMKVRFGVQPLQRKKYPEIVCIAEVVDRRAVRDSGGHSEKRLVIRTGLSIGQHQREIELTLTNRADMLFNMLLGRTALTGGILVNPQASYRLGRSLSKIYAQG